MFELVEYEIFNISGPGAEFGWRCQLIRRKTFVYLCIVRFFLPLELLLQILKSATLA